jgi:hypothetical protein
VLRRLAVTLLMLASWAAAGEDFADYPAVIREDVAQVKGIPTFEKLRGVTLLHVGGVPIMWEWRDIGGSWSKEWLALKSLSEVVKLEPDTEYSFDVLTLDDCALVKVDYPFKADEILVLRIRQGDRVVFDAGLRAKKRAPESSAPAAKASASSKTEVGLLARELLECRARCEHNATEGLGALSKSLRPSSSAAPLLMVQQPQHQPAVVVVVYDAEASGRESADVTVFEAACPDEYFPAKRVTLQRIDQDAPIFYGRAEIEGAHGTLVKVQYQRPGEGERPAVRYESETIGMAFH